MENKNKHSELDLGYHFVRDTISSMSKERTFHRDSKYAHKKSLGSQIIRTRVVLLSLYLK